ncbi:MAG: RNA polymerase sigma factor [Planctomycetota bacterium]
MTAADGLRAGDAYGLREPAPERDSASLSLGDADLARLARSGDRVAFSELYARYARAVHGVLLAAGPTGEANDLVQEVFLLALRSIAQLEEPERVGAWFFTIARNRARDALRHRPRTAELAGDVEPAARETDEDEPEDARAALAAIRSLPDAYRETLMLRLVEGLTGPEIADKTGLTHGSVRVNLHRGMKLLRERLARGGN